MRTSMKAVVIERPGPPEVLTLQERPVPKPKTGWALIRVRAFGLNRSELFTRQGHSPSVSFPRILGIEAVGEIVAAPGAELSPGQTVATAMGHCVRREYAQGNRDYPGQPGNTLVNPPALHRAPRPVHRSATVPADYEPSCRCRARPHPEAPGRPGQARRADRRLAGEGA